MSFSESEEESSLCHEDEQEKKKSLSDMSSSQKSNRSFDSGQKSNVSDEEVEMNQRERLESDLMKEASEQERVTQYQEEMMRDIMEKLEECLKASAGKSGEELVNLRIQELVYNKLLVLNYGLSNFRLVLAHYHLGEAYLTYDCVEQAIEHITIAMRKNEKMQQELPRACMLQAYLLITLAEVFMTQGNYDDAIEMLAQSLEVQGLRGEHDEKIVKVMVLQAQCYCKQKKFPKALEVINQVIEITRSKKMAKIEHAFSLVEKANIYAEMGNSQSYQEAIKIQEDAINILVEENYKKPEQVAEMYSTLAGYFEKIGNSESSLTCIQKVKTLYQELYSPEDKRVIKARRKIATSLLKSERFKEAVNELLEIVTLEESVFGQNCIQTARTLKLLGTVYISLEVGDAQAYLKRAMHIFASHGNKKQVQEIREKLKILMNGRIDNADGEARVISEQDI